MPFSIASFCSSGRLAELGRSITYLDAKPDSNEFLIYWLAMASAVISLIAGANIDFP